MDVQVAPRRRGIKAWLSARLGWVIFVGVLAYIGVGGWLLMWVPGALLLNWIPDVASTDERSKLLGSAAQIVLFGLGGVIAVVGVGLSLARKRDETTRLSIDRDANFTARYTEAIAQLGSTDSLAIRLGGVYALERIAEDSDRDHDVIVQVLAAYIRNDGRQRNLLQHLEGPDTEPRWKGDRDEEVTAAITVLGRLSRTYTQALRLRVTDLRRTDLRGARLRGAELIGADIFHTNLIGADLSHANLRLAVLSAADLTDANLSHAYMPNVSLNRATLNRAILRNTKLNNAKLRGAELVAADLTGADLSGAELQIADLTQANLTSADLSGANFLGANLQGVNFANATWNSSTVWPTEFIPPSLTSPQRSE